MIDLKSACHSQMKRTKDLILGFPWENKEMYASWLSQTYHIVSHSTRLVALASAYTPLEDSEMHIRFLDHAKEERSHERLCLADLKEIGCDLKDFPCNAEAAALPQIQYYWIEHRGPASLFGYILSLEVLAATFGGELYRKVCAAYGKKAGNFLKVHSEDDLEHTEKAFALLSKLDEKDLASMVENLEISASLYRSMLIDIKNSFSMAEAA